MGEAVERAYLAIRNGIASGRYPPGSHLRAQDLAGVSESSRTPVREALRRLHAEGLVTFIPNRGAFVAAVDEKDILKIYDLRVVLEGYAAESAAREATPAQIDDLHRLAQEMGAAVEADPPDTDAVTRINNAFHRALVAAAANARLVTALASIVEAPMVLRTFRHYGRDEMRRSMQQHLEIVEAVRARDTLWARSVMASHILFGRNALLQSLSLADPRRD